MSEEKFRFLQKVNSPAELKKLNEDDLVHLSDEVRRLIIDVVSKNSGHLGASLGSVELTVALHYIFNTPHDKIVWDVGHQAYGHKILTGRRDVFETNRKYKGISGFPKMSESVYDAFGVGHSSTSISAGLGMAIGSHLKNRSDQQVVAVIGDGSMTGGLAFEGLNNAGSHKSNLLVVLNDNNIAIDPSVGALNEYLLDIATSKTYNRLKNDVWNMLGSIDKLGPGARKYISAIENSIKTALLKHSNLFESLNFRYFGPVDGHDVVYLTKVLKDLKDIQGPKLLHVITKKGKGLSFAEVNQTIFHAPGKFDKITGKIFKVKSDKPQPPKYQEVFGTTLLELARKNKNIVGITPAMPSGSSMNIMMAEMPERVFDVGIAEQHAVTFSAGLAVEGLTPFCHIYSTFMQRAYDQVIHDVALQKLNVVLCLDRAGLVGDDGATHHGAYDIAYMRNIPNMIVAAPMDELELRNMLYTAQAKAHGPFSIRYPRGSGNNPSWQKAFSEIPVGKGRFLAEGEDIALISVGSAGQYAAEARHMLEEDNISVTHFDMRFVKPMDEKALHKIFRKHDKIITIEDGTISGGMGSALLEFMADHDYDARLKRLGIPDRFVDHGTVDELVRECGFDAEGIYKQAYRLIKPNVLSNAG